MMSMINGAKILSVPLAGLTLVSVTLFGVTVQTKAPEATCPSSCQVATPTSNPVTALAPPPQAPVATSGRPQQPASPAASTARPRQAPQQTVAQNQPPAAKPSSRTLPDPQRVNGERDFLAPSGPKIHGFINQRVNPTERSFPAPPASSVEGIIGLPVR